VAFNRGTNLGLVQRGQLELVLEAVGDGLAWVNGDEVGQEEEELGFESEEVLDKKHVKIILNQEKYLLTWFWDKRSRGKLSQGGNRG